MTARGVGLFAPAGYVHDVAAIERAQSRLQSLGFEAKVDPTCRSRWQRFSAPDDERLASLMRMAGDPDIELVIAARGGYGWSRLLEHIDWRTVAAARKRWMGHSDFTAFQLAALTHAGMITFGGPMACYDFGAEQPSPFTLDHFQSMYEHGADTVECPLEGPDFAGEGTLWGGNLAIVAHLVGSPHLPQTRGGILFIEDIGEHPYRVERMLHQLHFAGVLQRQRAVLLGVFNGYEAAPNDNGYDMSSVVAHARRHFGVAMFTGLAFGHCPDKLTLPVGGHCRLTVHDGAARIELTLAPRTGR